MTAQPAHRHGPPWGWVAAVLLLHLAALSGAPRRVAPHRDRPGAPALLTRALPAATVATPAPPTPTPQVATEPAANPPPARNPAPTRPAKTATAPSPGRAAVQPIPAPAAPTRIATPAPAVPVQVPGPATLRYAVSTLVRGQPSSTEAELRWWPEAGRYQALWSVGPRQQRSEGRLDASGLVPERFAEIARGERAAHFDPDGGRIRFSANTPDVALAPGAQDRLSVALQLGALLAAAPERYPPGTRIAVQTAGAREAPTWVWEVLDDDTLQLEGQPLPSARLLRPPQHEYDTRIELWLARTHGHLPARLRVTLANGDVQDQQLRGLTAPASGKP